MHVSVLDGNIATVKADGLITAINSSGMWFGGIDSVIGGFAGSQYHNQLADALRLNPNLQAFVAAKHSPHSGSFERVVFVIDDLNEPLNVIVRRGLTAANAAGLRSVTMPLIRFGVMRRVGGSDDEKLEDMAMAINGQMADIGNRLESVTIVVYGDLALSTLLRQKLGVD